MGKSEGGIKVRRDDILEFANVIVNGSREASYGDPKDSFGRIARLWSAVVGKDLIPSDVALMLVLLKVSRLVNDRSNLDSWIDLCGYASLGGELSFDGESLMNQMFAHIFEEDEKDG